MEYKLPWHEDLEPPFLTMTMQDYRAVHNIEIGLFYKIYGNPEHL